MLKVISSCSLFSLQKLCISSELNRNTSGQYALIKVNPKIDIICQIFCKRNVNVKYGFLNCSVIRLGEVDELKKFCGKNKSIISCVNELNLDELVFIRQINNLRTINVTVVFKNSDFTSKWKSDVHLLKNIVKEILKFVVVSNKVVIFPECLKVCENIGIYCILVHSTDSDFGKIISSTNIIIDSVISKNWVFNYEPPFVSGLDNTFRLLKDCCLLEYKRVKSTNSSKFSNNVLLSGPPGCGKTRLVQCVASDCGFPLLSVFGPELCSPQPGLTEQKIKNIFNEASSLASEKPDGVCIILLDQIESLCSSKSSATHVLRIESTILQCLDSLLYSPGVIVIATTDRSNLLSSAMRRPPRFYTELVMGVPNESERHNMISSLCKDCEMNISSSVCEEVARWTPGYVVADLKLLISNVARELLKFPESSRNENNLKIWQSCLLSMRPSTLRGELGIVSTSNIKMADIGGMSFAKNALKRAVEWPFLYYDSFERLGIPPTKGILLYGPPGCAKTSLVRAIASSCNTTFLAISAAALYSPYVGEAERTVSQLFQRARLGAPTILFIDEIDALVGCRGDDSREKGVHERVLSAFLIEMDGIGIKVQNNYGSNEETNKPSVIVIAATNQPQMLDAALLRPGRFDRLVYVGPPNREERLDILLTLTRKIPLGLSVDLDYLADVTTFFSGADLSQLCKEAGLVAMTEEGMNVEKIEQKHWIQAFEDMKPSLTKNQVDKYKDFIV